MWDNWENSWLVGGLEHEFYLSIARVDYIHRALFAVLTARESHVDVEFSHE
jgi:hypothetical protein